MDDKLGHEQCVAFGKSLRRMAEILQGTNVSSETPAVAAVVLKVISGFRIMGRAYADQLVKKGQEVRVLQKEKQRLENKVEQLGSLVSNMVSGKATVLKDASNVVLTNTIKTEEQVKNHGKLKDGHVQGNLHIKCEEELIQRELELAKLREAYTVRSFELRECRREVHKLEIRLKNAENQAVRKEEETFELLKAHTDEITNLKNDIFRLKEETLQLSKEAGRLEEHLGKATLKNEQFVELLKKDSKHQDELRRQQKALKGYLQLLALKFASSQDSEDLQFERRGLECRGLDDDTTSYLKTILERGFKPAKCSVGTQTMLNDVSHSSSSTHTRYSTATEGTQTSSGNPSRLHPVVPPLTKEIDVLGNQWNLNFGPNADEFKPPQNLDVKDHDVIRCPDSTQELWKESFREKGLDHAGSKRPIEVIDLGSDTDEESDERHDVLQHKYRQLSFGLETVGSALDIPLYEPSSTEVPMGRKEARKCIDGQESVMMWGYGGERLI